MRVLLLLSLLWTDMALARGVAMMMTDGRIKLQFGIPSTESKGAFELRKVLLTDNFADDEGMVDTGDSLYPLRIYDYLYENGTFIFTIILPPSDSIFFASFDKNPSFAFGGTAAQKLFEIVKEHFPRYDFEGSIIEQYRWGTEESTNYCDKTKEAPTEYRCAINL